MGKVYSGSRNPNWRGGRSIASNGYVLIRVGVEHHLSDVRGYAYEHRIVAEQKLGRRLRAGELVHHKDEDKQNNHPDNLVVKDGNAEHFLEHRRSGKALRLPGEPNTAIACGCGCGATFAKYDDDGRPRLYAAGHNVQARPTCEAILAALRGAQTLSRAELLSRVGLTETAVATALSKLKRSGEVTNVGHGQWSVAHGR